MIKDKWYKPNGYYFWNYKSGFIGGVQFGAVIVAVWLLYSWVT